jgi:hypothetical protein
MEIYGRTGQATDDNITRRMRFTCWITKATDTHSEYVTLTAFPQQQWLRRSTKMLRHTHIAFFPTGGRLWSISMSQIHLIHNLIFYLF